MNWVRLVEVDGILYYVVAFYDSVHVAKVGTNKLVNLGIPPDAKGTYLYVTRDNKQYVDMLLLAADQSSYEKGENNNYYVRIPKIFFTTLE